MSVLTCPRCKAGSYVAYGELNDEDNAALEAGVFFPALSRTDNNTYVCSDCGTAEALEDWAGMLTPQDKWPLPPAVPTPRIVVTERKRPAGVIAYSPGTGGWLVYDVSGDDQPGLHSEEASLTDALNTVRLWEKA